MAEIFGAIYLVLRPIVSPIGQFMVNWINIVYSFLKDNLFGDLTLYIIICVIIVVAGIIVNIVWPGNIKGNIFSKGKTEEFKGKVEKDEEDIVDSVKRCKDCGNPIGDADVCPLCGARN
ncbi:MAG: hypothetical protein ACFFDH_01830 [Promethearchaeota archaeon]